MSGVRGGASPWTVLLFGFGMAAGLAIGHLATSAVHAGRVAVPGGMTEGTGQLCREEDGSYVLSVSSKDRGGYDMAVRFRSPVALRIGDPAEHRRATHLPRVSVEVLGPPGSAAPTPGSRVDPAPGYIPDPAPRYIPDPAPLPPIDPLPPAWLPPAAPGSGM